MKHEVPIAMQNDSKTALTPKLRLPEFQYEPWQEKLIGDFLQESRIKGSTGNVARKLTVRLWGKGVFEKIESLSGSENTLYYRRKAGQFIYSKLDFLNQAFGIIPPELDGLESTTDLPCFDISSELHPNFLLEYVKRPSFYKKFGEIADGGRKAKRIQPESFLSFPICVPRQFAEQKKIAECLSTLDDLIEAERRKLDALRDHKKGLMQRLFPREGETRPRLRFPEFQNAGEWEETRLEHLGEVISGLTYSPDDVRESGLLVLRASNIQDGAIALSDNVYVDPMLKGVDILQSDDILICVRNGSKALIGKSALIPTGMPVCTHGAFMAVFRSRSPKFVFQLFQTPRYHKQVAGDLGATINSINGRRLLKYTFLVPKLAEQHRIAECLGTLDALTAAQKAKVEALRTHKRGLMQQLFPNPSGFES
jgi:type I restriction enzyme S subunit